MRSRESVRPIFVFEGLDDVGPYSVWVGRCNDSTAFEPLPANGKDQILLFRSNVRPHETYLRLGIYFFLDRDFDDLKGYATGPDLFLTEMYSIENYLASERVLESILVDELKCAGEPIDRALSLFHAAMESFFAAMSPANRRVFHARRLSIGLKGSGIENRIAKYVVAELESARAITDSDSLKILIPLEREPDTGETTNIDIEFEELDPHSRHRGKFILAFFLKWLDLLAEERSAARKGIFDTSVRPRFSAQQLSRP
ncbi:hypothetical protein V1283_009047 [Bradyrhizobium sp. AZCC 2262]|uniref:DUF4435 domain-containing protein n=1 Tax=Bradyrhizobium sp. AZCC 2262 TaxID=3117022 RepID=UPI002FF1B213